MIVEKIREAKDRKRRVYPVHANRASEIGHECLRYLVLNRTRWQEKSLHDIGLQYVFDMGTAIENIVMDELREAGLTVLEQQRPFSWPEYQITGSIDGKIVLNGNAYPLEIKSASPYAFDSINTAEDIKKHKYHYMRKYISQLTLYMLMDNKDRGVIVFKNKTTGQLKEIWFDLDYDVGESLLKKAEAINKHVNEGTLPDPIEYNESICGDCGYLHICLPEVTGKEVEIDTGNLAEMLDRLEGLKKAKKEYEEIDGQVKKMVEGREKILAGNWFISGTWIEKKEYTVQGGKYWRRSVRKI